MKFALFEVVQKITPKVKLKNRSKPFENLIVVIVQVKIHFNK